MPELFIPRSSITSAALAANEWYRQIPIVFGGNYGIDCKNLLAPSPPTLLEEYEVVSYAIGWSVLLFNSGGIANPAVQVELAFLINDRVRYTTTEQPGTVAEGADSVYASGAFVGDLVNPFRLGARDRLSLRAGILSSIATTTATPLYIGTQFDPNGNELGYESTITYNTLELPARRRL